VSSFSFEVTADEAGRRLDVALVRRLEGLGRAGAKRLVEQGAVQVNGRKVRKGAVLARGDLVEITELPGETDFAAVPDPGLSLEVLFEDAEVVVVCKPAGVPTHPLRAGEAGTAAGALVARYPEMAEIGYSRREPGVCHRLDNDTSGILLAARTARAFERLTAELKAGGIDKEYVALCVGRLRAPRLVDFPIAGDPKNPRVVRVCQDPRDTVRLGGREALTEVLRAEPIGRFTRVEVSAHSARRHQVRAHLAAVGHPLAGDELYGGPPLPGLDGHFLHASMLAFTHPSTGERVEVRAELPPRLEAVLDALEDA
jgi:23S rRNA pseudouridine1911/1915/1917 synthase